jgi:hypothetical protein
MPASDGGHGVWQRATSGRLWYAGRSVPSEELRQDPTAIHQRMRPT